MINTKLQINSSLLTHYNYNMIKNAPKLHGTGSNSFLVLKQVWETASLLKDSMKTAWRLGRHEKCKRDAYRVVDRAHLGCCSIWNEAKQVHLNRILHSLLILLLYFLFFFFFVFFCSNASPYLDGWCRSLSKNLRGASDLGHYHHWWHGWWLSLQMSPLHPV